MVSPLEHPLDSMNPKNQEKLAQLLLRLTQHIQIPEG